MDFFYIESNSTIDRIIETGDPVAALNDLERKKN